MVSSYLLHRQGQKYLWTILDTSGRPLLQGESSLENLKTSLSKDIEAAFAVDARELEEKKRKMLESVANL